MSTGVILAIKIVISVILCYFLGSLNASYLLGKAFKQKDVRDYGSHNPGSTNAIRAFGPKFGFICMAVDIAKGVVAMLLVRLIMWHTLDQFQTKQNPDLLVLIQLGCGLVCMLGHMYPFYMKFKGGKGIAVSLGVLITINWKIFLIAGIPALIILAIFRIMSVASLSFETLIFIMYIAFYGGHQPFGWFIILAAFFYPGLAYYGHRANLKRLVHGKEPRLWGEGSPKKEEAKELALHAAEVYGASAAGLLDEEEDDDSNAADDGEDDDFDDFDEDDFVEEEPPQRTPRRTSSGAVPISRNVGSAAKARPNRRTPTRPGGTRKKGGRRKNVSNANRH